MTSTLSLPKKQKTVEAPLVEDPLVEPPNLPTDGDTPALPQSAKSKKREGPRASMLVRYFNQDICLYRYGWRFIGRYRRMVGGLIYLKEVEAQNLETGEKHTMKSIWIENTHVSMIFPVKGSSLKRDLDASFWDGVI